MQARQLLENLKHEERVLKRDKEKMQRAKDLLSEHGFMLEVELFDHGETCMMGIWKDGEQIHYTYANDFNMKDE